MNRLILFSVLFNFGFIVAVESRADGTVIDKVYHPYVLPNEHEVEWRLVSWEKNGENILGQRLGFGHAISENISVEGYVNGQRDNEGNFGLQSYEIEARWALTDQGKYWADWGMLFELEKEHQRDHWEATTALLVEKEFGRTSLTMNMFAVLQWGTDFENEFKGEFRLKYRYRWIPQIQPAIEVYIGEEFSGLGPAFMGIQRYNNRKQLKWEAGFIIEVSSGSTHELFRLALEYEF